MTAKGRGGLKTVGKTIQNKVLIADDEPTLRQLLQTNLMLEGFDTCEAKDGAEALRAVEEEAPDVMILDIMMPIVDGLQVLDALEQTGPPVVVLSAKVATADQRLGWESGCDEYITKPFDVEDLIESIREVASRSPEQRLARRKLALEALDNS